MQLAEDDPAASPVSVGTLDLYPDAGLYQELVTGILVDGPTAFVGIPFNNPGQSTITEFSLCGQPPRALTPNLSFPGVILQDDKAIYWGGFGGAITRLAK